MAKLCTFGDGDDHLMFDCPGCGYGHHVTVNGKKNGQGASWRWNGSIDAPTFEPSILCNVHHEPSRCHSFVRDGKIQFLSDCWHKLAGQTVELPEVEP